MQAEYAKVHHASLQGQNKKALNFKGVVVTPLKFGDFLFIFLSVLTLFIVYVDI